MTTGGNQLEGGGSKDSSSYLDQSHQSLKRPPIGVSSSATTSQVRITPVDTHGSTIPGSQSSTSLVRGPASASGQTSTLSQNKRSYLYCVDTRQIVNMIEYSIQMMSIGTKQIQEQIENLEKQTNGENNVAKTNREIISELYSNARSKSSNIEQPKNDIDQKSAELVRTEIFCAGNKDMLGLAKYINHKLQSAPKVSKPAKTLFEQAKESQSSNDITFARIFSFDERTGQLILDYMNKENGGKPVSEQDLLRFTYFVENEKILSKKMFYVDVQRELVVTQLKEMKKLLQSFIQRKYKNCITKIGFSSEKELFNIFNKMFQNNKGFFSNHTVRTILSCFWMSIREIFFQIRLKQFQDNKSTHILPLTKLSMTTECLLKNNFYLRLEFIARGRLIFEQAAVLQQMQALTNRVTSTDEKLTYAKMFPLHQAIFENNLRLLSKLLKQELDGVFLVHKNALDLCGNTPLMLAVKLCNLDAVKVLSDVHTCPKLRPLPDLMNAKEIAIAMKQPAILKILISSNQKIKQQFFEQNMNAIFQVLEQLPDFKVDLNLTCDSNWFPVFSSVAPSDTYKIYKQGSNLRLDMTLLGLQKFNLIKGNISVLYKGRNSTDDTRGDLLIVDNKLSTVNSIFMRNNEAKVNQQIQEILTGKQVLKKYQTHSLTTNIETDRNQNPIYKTVNGYDCQKWTLKSKYTMCKYQMNLAQIDQIKGLKSFEEYISSLKIDFVLIIESTLFQDQDTPISNFLKRKHQVQAQSKYDQAPNTSRINLGGTTKLDNKGGLSSRGENMRNLDFSQQMHTQEDQNNSTDAIFGQKQVQNMLAQNNKQITIKKSQQKSVNANLWLSKMYPFDIEQFLPLIHILSFCSKQIRQFNKFLLKYPLPKSCFPVEARIPLFMTMEAVFSFKNLQLGFNDKSVFDIDEVVAIKQQENMALYAKQQISYLNMQASLDTQEDKQAKALKEIYKLCKTDEGESGDIYGGDLYKVIEEGHQYKEDGYDSENSEKIKDLFEKMRDEAYDIKQDLLLIEENENEDFEDLLGDTKKSDPEQITNSRNFAAANKNSFREFKQSFTHNELLKLRKSLGGPTGRTASIQFSMQSDVTESIEVSERSFNDKLAKLQIHSFQNVKFMSQLKKSKLEKQSNLQKILAEQFEEPQNIVFDYKIPQSQLEHFNQQSQLTKHRQLQRNQSANNVSWAKEVKNQRNLVHHLKNNVSNLSHASSMHHENIYDSKLNEVRPQINKSLGKHQINNNLHLYAKAKNQALLGGRPPISAVQPGNQKKISQEAKMIALNHSSQTIMKEFVPRQIPRQLKHNILKQPNNQIGLSAYSLVGTNVDSSFGGVITHSHFSGETRNYLNMHAMGPPTTTADSGSYGGHKNQQTPASVLSMMGDKRAESIDKDLNSKKLKMLIGNLRNPDNNNSKGPRYLNTIESEGNLPTAGQHFGSSKQNDNLMSKASCNQISQHSIHTLESLQSEGSQGENDNNDRSKPDDSSFQRFMKAEIRSQGEYERCVPLHTGDQDDDVNEPAEPQVFSYEKQHRDDRLSLDPGSSTKTVRDQKAQPIIKKIDLADTKLNFFQKVSNFIQESITDRKSASNTIQVQLQQNLNSIDRVTNEDEFFNHNLSDIKKQKGLAPPRSLTHKKFNGTITSPKRNEILMSPIRSSQVPPATAGRDDIKQAKLLAEQKEGGSVEPQCLKNVRNTTQTDGSNRDLSKKIAPQNILMAAVEMSPDYKPYQEGQICNVITHVQAVNKYAEQSNRPVLKIQKSQFRAFEKN